MSTKIPDYLKFNNETGHCDITLSRPLDVSGVKIAVLRMREPTVADQEIASDLPGTDASREIATFANLCEQSPDDIRKLPLKDYKRLQAAYVNFID